MVFLDRELMDSSLSPDAGASTCTDYYYVVRGRGSVQ